MIPEWVTEELQTLDLGDARRDARLRSLLADLAPQPTVSLPAAVGGGRAETEAVYRFFENDHFDFTDILTPHCDATLERIRAQKVVVVAQETSEIDLTRPKPQVQGAGPWDEGARRGCLWHALHAFTEAAVSRGTVGAETWARVDPPRGAAKQLALKQPRQKTPLEDQESQRGVDGLHLAHRSAAQVPDTQVILVSDSEADIFELLVAGQFPDRQNEPPTDATAAAPTHAQWIVRGGQNRAVLPDEPASETSPLDDAETKECLKTVLAKVSAAPVLKSSEVPVRGRDPKVSCETRGRRQARQSRTAHVEVRACAMTLRPPYRPDRKRPAVTLNVVLVRETDPPEGDEAIEGLRLTSLPIDTPEPVLRVITTYALRWHIEIFFRVLKQGCRWEARRFETLDNVWRDLAVALVISWRTLFVMRMGREFPDLSCEAVFEVSEWKAVSHITPKKPPPKTPPTLREMVRMVGQLGGFVNRSIGAMPGVETIWKGLQRMHDMALCWDAFGPTNSG